MSESALAERRRRGADRWDEVWEGVLHVVPAPSYWHQELGTRLLLAIAPLAQARGLVITYETNVLGPAGTTDYRVPDIVVAREERRARLGVEGGPELVVEILSPDDESRQKLPFYARIGTREVLLVDPDTRAVELLRLRGEKLVRVEPDAEGALLSEVLGASFATVAGPHLRVAWEGGASGPGAVEL